MVEYPLSIEEEEDISEQVKNLSDSGKLFRIEQVRFIVAMCGAPTHAEISFILITWNITLCSSDTRKNETVLRYNAGKESFVNKKKIVEN